MKCAHVVLNVSLKGLTANNVFHSNVVFLSNYQTINVNSITQIIFLIKIQ